MEPELKPEGSDKVQTDEVSAVILKVAIFVAVSLLLSVVALPRWANHRDAAYVERHDCKLDAKRLGPRMGGVMFGFALPITEKDEYYYECHNPDVIVEVDK
jgi:hypothetical protein